MWVLVRGTTWQPAGHLRLIGQDEHRSPYRAVSPYFPVQPGERLALSGRARTENGAQLRFCYYQRDGELRCFGYDRIPGQFSHSDADGFTPFEFEFQMLDSDELKFIALIVYCYHADGGLPVEGDAVVIDKLTVTRR